MAKSTGLATWARFVCLLVSGLALPCALVADLAQPSRYALASGGHPVAPTDPRWAPGDPTFAPGDPREPGEPRDMTGPRAVRRALRGRSRDRVAPDHPVAPPLRDFTETPTTGDRAGLGRRFETLFRVAPVEPSLPNPILPSRPVRVAPAEPVVAAPTPPSLPRIAPPSPSSAIEPADRENLSVNPAIRLTQGKPELQSDSAAEASAVTPAAVNDVRLQSLNTPIAGVSLVEAVDLDGRRPVDVSAGLTPPQPPILMSGSCFAEAHPARYLYCFSHNPLYFEEANLERCGIAHCCQPAVSAARFIGRTALLPYSLIAAPPCSCVTTLGDCPTCHAYPCGADWHR